MTVTYDPSKKIHEQITRETWNQGWFFKYPDGDTSDTNNYRVCSACALGWLAIAYNDNSINGLNTLDQYQKLVNTPTYQKYINGIVDSGKLPCVGNVNDAITYEEVIQMLKEADL